MRTITKLLPFWNSRSSPTALGRDFRNWEQDDLVGR